MSEQEYVTLKALSQLKNPKEDDCSDDEGFKTIPILRDLMLDTAETVYFDPIYSTMQHLPLAGSSSSSKNDTYVTNENNTNNNSNNSFDRITDTCSHSSGTGTGTNPSKYIPSACDAFEIMSLQIQRSYLPQDRQRRASSGISECIKEIADQSNNDLEIVQEEEEEPVSVRQLARVQTTKEGGQITIPEVHKNDPYKNNICMRIDAQADIKYGEKSFLGEGSFGKVHSGIWNGKKVAVKIFKEEYQTCLGPECTRIFESEFDILAKIHHENIVESYGGNKEISKRAIVMEYMDRGSLDTFIHRNNHAIKLVNFYKIIKGISKALAYLHPTIVHRDIKPQNVLLNKQGLVKVADFGLSKFKEATTLFSSNAAGTPHYVAPEVLTGKYERGSQVDIYSVAILMWELYTRQRPWHGVKDYQIAYLVMTDQRPEIPLECPQDLSDMIKKCWAPNPADRPTSQDLYLWCKQQIEKEAQRPEPILLYKTNSSSFSSSSSKK